MKVPTVILTEMVEPDSGKFASYCLELGIASCGDTEQEAYDRIREAIELQLNALEEMGLREQEFEERGIEVVWEEVPEIEDHRISDEWTRLGLNGGAIMDMAAERTDARRTARYLAPVLADA